MYYNDINEILRIAGVKLNEREDLTKFNRIAGFYHLDTKQFELFPRTSEDISTDDDEINDYIHNVYSKDEFIEFHIVRFGIEDIPGEGVVCYIEADTKRHAEECYYAILDNYAEDCNIIKYELEYYVGNKPKYIFLNRYGDEELVESIAYVSKKDLSDIILKNPTKRELRENNLALCRCIEDSEGNWYFADMENMLHAYIVYELKDEASFPLFDGNDCYGIAYYDAESNEFWYNLNDYMYKKECIEQYNNSEYLRTTFPNARVIPNPWNNQMYDELYDEEDNEDLNESYDRMDRPFIWNDPTYSQFHRILRDNTTYGKLSAIIDNGHIYCWDSALSHHDSVVKDIEESGIKLSDDYIWVRFKEPNLCWVSAAYFDDYTDEDLEDLPQQDFEKELEDNPIIKKYFPQGVKVVRFDNIE